MRVPLVVPITPVWVMSPAPARVRSKVAPVMPPVRVRVPASLWRVLAEPRVRAPVRVLAPETLRRAPAGAAVTPAPLRVRASPVTVRLFWTSRAAPLATEVLPVVVPRAVLLWMFTAPALMVVAPL